jgi:hypothetical protein
MLLLPQGRKDPAGPDPAGLAGSLWHWPARPSSCSASGAVHLLAQIWPDLAQWEHFPAGPIPTTAQIRLGQPDDSGAGPAKPVLERSGCANGPGWAEPPIWAALSQIILALAQLGQCRKDLALAQPGR